MVHRSIRGHDGMFLRHNPELVVDKVLLIPVRDDIVRDGTLQCQDTAFALRLVTNIIVFWSMPSMLSGMLGVAADAAQKNSSSAMAAVSRVMHRKAANGSNN